VIDLIRAKAAKSLKMANGQLRGNLSHEIEELGVKVVKSLALVEGLVDFSDEEIEVDSSRFGIRSPLFDLFPPRTD
jgi:tRNA U34 5-carboxymethylaminomethyl modifying GTPase MnmE/TrmE